MEDATAIYRQVKFSMNIRTIKSLKLNCTKDKLNSNIPFDLKLVAGKITWMEHDSILE